MGEETKVTLEIFDDGFVANSRHSTGLCDLFLGEVLGWIGKRFDVNYRSIQIRERMYRSELVVAMDHSLADVCTTVDEKLAESPMAVKDRAVEVVVLPQRLECLVAGQ